MNNVYVHLISDSTGETVSAVTRAVLAQFQGIDFVEKNYNLIRSEAQIIKALNEIANNPGPVVYTLVKKELRDLVRQFGDKNNLPCISVLGAAITQFSAYLGVATKSEPGLQHELNDNYFNKIEAINFALSHDDGQNCWNLESSDVILTGPSRTSKSPTCIYLANKGLRAANVPLVSGIEPPKELLQASKPLVVGLIIDPKRLLEIRHSRLVTMGGEQNINYVDDEQVAKEVTEAKRLFVRHKWATIDVTKKSIEETATNILQLLKARREKLYGSL
jgi:[pyruvate, water dikinase]-phosphate phosphotransferase / [pyruvate, water dikinase] kinase